MDELKSDRVTSFEGLSELRDVVKSVDGASLDKKVFVGFDGFVDKIKRAVRSKQNNETVYYDSIREFADRIALAAGKSGQIQMDTVRTKFGGNAPILASTLGKLGMHNYCLGSMGYPGRQEVFAKMHPLVQPISALNPGLSDAIEFSDGKIILSELEVFESYDWSHIMNVVGLERLTQVIGECALVAFVDWANLPHASDIWQGMLNDVIKPLKRHDFYFLFDLCDPSKKTTQQIDEVLDLVSSFSGYGKVTLGLNENETLRIWCALNGHELGAVDSGKLPSVREAGDALYKTMCIDALLVHPIDRSLLFKEHSVIELQGRLVTSPKVLTGGGDNLNAGYCLGLLHQLSEPQCMLLGMAASGAYIENGLNPDCKDIVNYLDRWIGELRQKEGQYMQTDTGDHIFHSPA
ncbi:MAG: hypothetical protein HC859_12525 [Bacteroidia bacterium]|nr:hypothetical protein [Bacteroidia bacterium]